MATDPELRAHQQWLGYLQPVGLVVSPPALAAAQAQVQKNIVPQQQILIDLVGETDPPGINDLPGFCRQFLGWQVGDIAGLADGPELPKDLDVSLADYGEVLSPSYAVPDSENEGRWLMLLKSEPRTLDLDAVPAEKRDDQHWHASPQARFERLLREREIPIGLLSGGTHLRLVYAPKGESSGYLTFPVVAMCEVAGRPIVAALHMLLSSERLFSVPTDQRLPAILRNSRKYQNDVSTRLAAQVLDSLYELLRGFQAANDATKGELLREVLKQDPQSVYGGLLGTLMRLVFVLYAEDRGMLPIGDAVYQQHYSVSGLFERLRDDNSRYPDTMGQRYGAWAQLLTLFRLIYDGAAHGSLRLTARHGHLFDPDTWDFLEGRPWGDQLDRTQILNPPHVADSVVYKVLENLMVLDGERISYRALDVEQIGSVYEAMMGFELRQAQGPSIGVRPQHVVCNLDSLLSLKPADRAKGLKDEAGSELSGQALEALKAAKTAADVVAALGKKLSPRTPSMIPKDGLFLQPTEERRRSGSHYTPRPLTQPIVQTTLEPLLRALGESPTPEHILDLKVCDPAMGSGAFLVETCRFLGDALAKAWGKHGRAPKIPPDEDDTLVARRLVAQRCLYGVDKNHYAVDLAKLSLWLATLARDHPFTFLDHALRHGDSLVGLTREQIASFHWAPKAQLPMIRGFLDRALKEAEEKRAAIHRLGDSDDNEAKTRLHAEAVHALDDVRLAGDVVIAAFFGKERDGDREVLRSAYEGRLSRVLERKANPQELYDIVDVLRGREKPVPPFHWEIEFPEIFSRANPGFDALAGNPPFLGGTLISGALGRTYLDLLGATTPGGGDRMDLVGYFFRRGFGLLRANGCLGFVATNTVAQGDTRKGGLAWILQSGGSIYSARKRLRWPGYAAVVVSVVHLRKGPSSGGSIDGRPAPRVTAFLFHAGGNGDPATLFENEARCSIGTYVFGSGFVFGPGAGENSIDLMQSLTACDPRNQDRIFPYVGGEEVNDSPTHAPRRFVIDLGEMSEEEARRWPDLMDLLERGVKPQRLSKSRDVAEWPWWRFWRRRADLYSRLASHERILVCARHQPHWTVAVLPNGVVYSDALAVFVPTGMAAFAVLQSHCHEVWARFFGSSMKDDLRYTPSDCFETYPFPAGWETIRALEAGGRAYHDFRAALMVKTNEGLTKTYNRFHNPEESDPSVVKLRELHDAMDRAVLDAYGWTDIPPTCEFLLDYEEEPEDADGKPSKRKKPWRYRWPDETRDEVLARLLALNQERAKEEASSGKAGWRKATKATRRGSPNREQGATLFDAEEDS